MSARISKAFFFAALALPLLTAGAVWAADPPKPAPIDPGKRVVGYIYGNIGITREELGEFLIARGGMEKLDLLINKRIIDIEADRRKISVTDIDIDAGLREDLLTFGFGLEEFEKTVLPRYGKTLYEWREDIIRPRLLLSKMCGDDVRASITEQDVMRLLETRYGERREAKIIVWPKGGKISPLNVDVKATARINPTEFDKLAARQPDTNLAQAGGLIDPIGRHIEGEDPIVEDALFSMQVNETRWVETEKASTCLRLVRILPPDPNVKVDDKLKERSAARSPRSAWRLRSAWYSPI